MNNATKSTTTTNPAPKPAPNPANGTARSNDDVARALRETLRGATKGLAAFRDSVARSGMPEALADYRKLQSVLVNQRMWASRLGRKELDPDFAALAKVVGDIHVTMAAYEQTFRPLKSLHLLRHDQALAPITEPAAQPATPAAAQSAPPPAPPLMPAPNAAAIEAKPEQPPRDQPAASKSTAVTTPHPTSPEHPKSPTAPTPQVNAAPPIAAALPLDPQLARMIEVLARQGELTLDSLRRAAKLTKPRAAALLAELESAGLVIVSNSQSKPTPKAPTPGKKTGRIPARGSRPTSKGGSQNSATARPKTQISAPTIKLSTQALGRLLHVTAHDPSRSTPPTAQ